MATSHPYISGPGNITRIVDHLRKSFPVTVNSDTVKKLGLASNNESYVINSLQFIGILDESSNRTEIGKSVFANHKDEDFQKSFADLVKKSYHALFDLHGDLAWSLSEDDLITFFRQSDETGAAVGTRQAKTFAVFAMLSGRREPILSKKGDASGPKPQTRKKNANSGNSIKDRPTVDKINHISGSSDLALTVRVEINLPVDGSKETYDNIFKSIKENLLNG